MLLYILELRTVFKITWLIKQVVVVVVVVVGFHFIEIFIFYKTLYMEYLVCFISLRLLSLAVTIDKPKFKKYIAKLLMSYRMILINHSFSM